MIKVGIAGARGLSTILGFREAEGVEVTAICDLDGELLEQVSREHNIPHSYRIFEDMLDSDIDAVVIATPMQCHVPQAILALQAGKHVMSEVTAGVTMDELWWLMETVEQTGKVYMFGENYCYMPENQLILTMARMGMFGETYYGEGEYLHELKNMTRYNYGPYHSGKTTWRNYWQYGKHGTFYPTHSIGPVMQWFGDERIASIATFTSGKHSDFNLRQEDTNITMCQMASGKLAKIRIDCISPRPHNTTYYQLQGTKGVVEAPRGLGDTHKIWLNDFEPDTNSAKWRPLSNYNHLLPERYRNMLETPDKANHGGGDFFIVQDFIDAVQNGTKPAIDVYQACEWTAVGLLSELSVLNGNRTMDMPYFRKNMPREEQFIKL